MEVRNYKICVNEVAQINLKRWYIPWERNADTMFI